MAVNSMDSQNLSVEDIDDEVFYREQLGCKASMEEGGNCATISCPGEKEVRMCQTPGSQGSWKVPAEVTARVPYDGLC